MAVKLSQGTTQNVQWADASWVNSLTTLSWSLAWKTPSSIDTSNNRIFGKWGNSSSYWCFLVQVVDAGGTFGFAYFNTSGQVGGRKTTSTVSTSTQHWIGGTYDGTQALADACTFYIDGADAGDAAWLNQTPTALPSAGGTGAFHLGRDPVGTTYSHGDAHAELGLWNRVLTPAEFAFLHKGYAPTFIPGGLKFYAPLTHATDLREFGNVAGTSSGTPTTGAHPRVIYPAPVFYSFPAAGGTTHDETAASTLTVTDTSSETATFPETATSTLSVTDTGSETATFPETSTSTLSITDTSEGTTAKVGASTSTLTVTDAASESAVFADSATSTLTVTDAGSETATFPESATSTLSVTDTSLGTTGVDKSATSTLSITDASSESATFAAAATSTLTVTDSSSELATFLKTAPDSIIFTDTATASGGEEIAAQRGGSSLSLRKMRELERLQMLQRDDDEIIALISRLME